MRFPWAASAFALYALLYFALIFQPGLVRFDDFGYLRSVAESLAAGRLLTDDWLQPYNAPLTALGVGAFLLTGEFLLATWGLLAVLVLANFLLLHRLLRFRFDPAAAALLALVFASMPPYWHKASEYAGTAPTLTFTLAALLAYQRGRWLWFFPAAFLAFANRQNGVALMVLPLWHLLFDRSAGRPDRRLLAGGLLAFGAAAVLLHALMNQTFTQRSGIYSVFAWERMAGCALTASVGVFVCLAALACLDLLGGADPRERLRANLRRPLLPAFLTALFVGTAWAKGLPLISFLTPLIGSLDRGAALQWILIGLVPALLWCLDYGLVRTGALPALAAAHVAIAGLAGYWYDYYLLDCLAAVLMVFLSRRETPRLPRPAAAILACLLAAHLAWALGFKVLLDKQRLSMEAYERLERQGRIGVEAMTDGTFGLLGYKLLDHMIRNHPDGKVWGFLGYARAGRVRVESETPWRRGYRRDLPAGALVLEEGKARIGYFTLRYRVFDERDSAPVSVAGGSPLPWDPGAYRTRPIPLNRREWNEFARQGGDFRPGPLDAPLR